MSGMDNPVAAAAAWALVHFLWQGTLVGLAIAGVLSLLERRQASTRYAVAVGALLLLAVLPVVTAVGFTPPVETPYAAAVTSPGSGILPAVPEPQGTVMVQTFGGSLLPWVLGLWLAGVAILSVYHLGGWSFARRLSRQGQPAEGTTTALLHDLRRRLGIRRQVTLLESLTVSVPIVVGWLRPVVLVPASALTGLSPAQLEAILAHELAHVRRHDYLVNLLQTAVETLLFYHPAVWWVSSQVRRERENCCDDLAVAVCGNRLSYARALVDLEGLRSPRLALAASGGSLSERVRRLVGSTGARPRRRFWAAGLLALALLPALAVVQIACSRDSAKRVNRASTADDLSDSVARRDRWKAEIEANELRLEVSLRKSGWGSWTSINDYPLADFTGLTKGSDVRFEMRRDAGTFRFRGSFDGKQGSGTVAFTGNPAFASSLNLSLTSDRLMELAMQGVSLNFIREVKELGYGGPVAPVKRASRDRSPAAFFRDLFRDRRDRDALLDQVVQLQAFNITPAYIRAMSEAGSPRPEPWQLIELRNHGIEPDYVKGLGTTGYRHLLPHRIVEFHTHGITPEWLRGIVEAGYTDTSPDQIISMHLHGVDGDSIRLARSRGYKDLSPEALISLRVRGKLS
jgi:beta-lactamase regulating signal transducer with metallopeptidase domain